MKTSTKKLLSFVLTLVMVVGIFPAVAFAEEGEGGEANYELRVLDFEGAQWDALIDSPQCGGPLLYGGSFPMIRFYIAILGRSLLYGNIGCGFADGSVAYQWTDEHTQLHSRLGKSFGNCCYWSGGHAISNYAAADLAAYGSLMSQLTVFDADAVGLARTGGGHNGSNNFAVHFGYRNDSPWNMIKKLPSLSFADGVARVVDHMYVNITTFTMNSLLNGSWMSVPGGDFYVTATGYNGETRTGETRIYLSDGEDILVQDWTKWDLSSLGKVTKIEFNVGGEDRYGFIHPPYFAYDDVAVRFETDGGEEPEDPAYTVTMPEDQSVIAGETILIPATIGHNADETTYNAFDMSFAYDKSILELTSTAFEGLTVSLDEDPENSNIGIVRVMGYGSDRDVGTAPFTLTFTAKATGAAEVTLTSAKVDAAANAISSDAPDAFKIDDCTVVTIGGYSVTLPEGFTGASIAAPGEDYTFSEPVDYYDYSVSATVGGEEVEVTDNGDGSYTIPGNLVNGAIVVSATKTGQVFNVTLGEDINGEATAQYMSDYSATLTREDGYTYEVSVTIGGTVYTDYAMSDDIYTIPGEDITGDIVFSVTKTPIPVQEFTVTFAGDGAGDAEGAATVSEGSDYVFTVNKAEGYTYALSATMGGQSVEIVEADDQYTIANVTGDLVITIEKEADMNVEVNSYVELDSKTIFLVTATGTLEEGKAYAYDGNAMFYSEVYEAWCYLTIEEGEFNAEIAKANIVATETSYITLTETCDVNMSGLVDINDAQLVYDIYNGKYQDFTSVEMQKFLNADTNGDKTVNVTDAAAVVAAIQ